MGSLSTRVFFSFIMTSNSYFFHQPGSVVVHGGVINRTSTSTINVNKLDYHEGNSQVEIYSGHFSGEGYIVGGKGNNVQIHSRRDRTSSRVHSRQHQPDPDSHHEDSEERGDSKSPEELPREYPHVLDIKENCAPSHQQAKPSNLNEGLFRVSNLNAGLVDSNAESTEAQKLGEPVGQLDQGIQRVPVKSKRNGGDQGAV